MWIEYNPNPTGSRVGDCAIRAICKATNQDWVEVYLGVCLEGLRQYDMPSSNAVWGMYLHHNGFTKVLATPGLTVSDFAKRSPEGTFVLVLSGHTVCIVDGNYYDSWDSGRELILYYWFKEV